MTKLQQDYDYLFKIVLIGDSGVGKTNLLSRFIVNDFAMQSRPTIGVQFATKTVTSQGKSIKTQIWDTAGQQRFRAITNAYYRGAIGSLIVYDITKRNTFQNVQKWLKELRDHSDPNISVILIGNKCDLNQARQVTLQQGKQFAQSKGLFFLQTSAKDSHNVQNAFMLVIKQINKILSKPNQNGNKPQQSLESKNKIGVPLAPKQDKAIKQKKKKGCC